MAYHTGTTGDKKDMRDEAFTKIEYCDTVKGLCGRSTFYLHRPYFFKKSSAYRENKLAVSMTLIAHVENVIAVGSVLSYKYESGFKLNSLSG